MYRMFGITFLQKEYSVLNEKLSTVLTSLDLNLSARFSIIVIYYLKLNFDMLKAIFYLFILKQFCFF